MIVADLGKVNIELFKFHFKPDRSVSVTISPVAYTQINPYIANADLTGASDLAALQVKEGTFADDLIEYSARVCYHSTAKMGTAPNFIGKLIEKSHLDTIEHPTAVVLINDSALVQKIQRISNHVHVVDNIVSANLRVWRDLVLQGIAIDALPFLRTIAPKAFSEFAGDEQMDFIKTCCNFKMGFPSQGVGPCARPSWTSKSDSAGMDATNNE